MSLDIEEGGKWFSLWRPDRGGFELSDFNLALITAGDILGGAETQVKPQYKWIKKADPLLFPI